MPIGVKRKSKKFGTTVPLAERAYIELEIHDQKFAMKGGMSGLALLGIMSALDGDVESLQGSSVADTFRTFLSEAFLEEDRERGMNYLINSDPPVTFPVLLEIIQWLVEEYTGNPTAQAEQSSATSENTGAGSSGLHSVPDATSATLTESPSVPSLPPMPLARY